MRPLLRTPALAALLSIACAATSHAGAGVNLRWDRCFGDGGVSNRNFACDTNAGSEQLVVSYVVPNDVAQVSGNEIKLSIASASASLPAWWQLFTTGNCRAGSVLAANPIPDPTYQVCQDYWQGNGAGGVAAYQINLLGSSNRAEIIAAFAVPQGAIGPISAGVEYFSCNLVLRNLKTVGLGACAGCGVPACLLLAGVNVTTPTTNVCVAGPTVAGSDQVSWQGGGGPLTVVDVGLSSGACGPTLPFVVCGAATPARNGTWGAVKSLYR